MGEAQLHDESLGECRVQARASTNGYFFDDGDRLLRRRMREGMKDEECLVLPTVCRGPILKYAHELGHFGADKTWSRLKYLYDWPKMRKDIKKYCQSCIECQKQRRTTVFDRVPIKILERPDVAFDTVSLDCAGPIEPPSARGHHYVMVMIDHCTRWCECIPLKTLTAKEIRQALNVIFQRIGIPRVVVSDNGTNFVSNLNKIFFSKFGIEVRNSTPLHPQGNSLAERLVQNVKKMLHHIIISEEPRSWDLKLPFLLWALRTMENESTGFSPFEMVYGRQGRGPLDIINDTWKDKTQEELPVNKTAQAYLDKLREDIKIVSDIAASSSAETQRSYTERYNMKSKEKSFNVGDQVLVLLPDSTNKLKSSWQGPAIIQGKLSENSYMVNMSDGAVRNLHANHLRQFRVPIGGVGVIFEDESENFGEIECCETG